MLPNRFLRCLLPFLVMLEAANAQEEEAEGHWGYEPDDGPGKWCDIFPNGHCCGHRQSPVNIVKNDTVPMQDKLELHNYKYFSSHSTITNNGKSAMVQLHGMEKTPYVRIGSHISRFMLDSFHFHWGSPDQNGSEHTVDGQRYPLEMHLVHINSRYRTLTEARDYFNGIAVVSLLFELSDTDDPEYDMLINTLSAVKVEGSHASIKRNFSLTSLLPKQFGGLYAYKGSLTTPPCSESVTWFIAENHMPISSRQVDQFRKLQAETKPAKDGNGSTSSVLETNFRPLQPLNGRYVFYLMAELADRQKLLFQENPNL